MQSTPSSVAAHSQAGIIEAHAVEAAGGAVGEFLAARERAVGADVEDADVLREIGVPATGGIDDEQTMLVGGKRQAVWPDEIVGDDANLAGRAVHAVDVVAADLALGLVPFVVRQDAVGGIGEPEMNPSERTTTSFGLFSRLPLY